MDRAVKISFRDGDFNASFLVSFCCTLVVKFELIAIVRP